MTDFDTRRFNQVIAELESRSSNEADVHRQPGKAVAAMTAATHWMRAAALEIERLRKHL